MSAVPAVMLIGLAAATGDVVSSGGADADTAAPPGLIAHLTEPIEPRVLDTLYVADTSYLDVRLDSQVVYHRCRSGAVHRYPCSTGNIKLKKAIETTEGIFTIQSRTPLAYSRQFDSTKMFFWVGFNGNIGFHGLDGRGYYRFLGRRPSSHGCIRLAKESAEKMYRTVAAGTPVIVHRGDGARVLAFAAESDTLRGERISVAPHIRSALRRQLAAIYRGRAYLEPYTLFYFQGTRLWWGGMEIGSIDRVPARQRRPPCIGLMRIASNDVLRSPSIPKGN